MNLRILSVPLFTSHARREHIRNRARITPESLLKEEKTPNIRIGQVLLPLVEGLGYDSVFVYVRGEVPVRGRVNPGKFVDDEGKKSLARSDGTRSLPILTTIVVLCKLDVE